MIMNMEHTHGQHVKATEALTKKSNMVKDGNFDGQALIRRSEMKRIYLMAVAVMMIWDC